MDALEQARAEIDTVDAQLAALFERRMAAVLQVAEYKRAHGLPIYDAAREAAVLEKAAARIQQPALRPYYKDHVQHMMDLAKPVSYTHLDVYKRQHEHRVHHVVQCLHQHGDHHRDAEFQQKGVDLHGAHDVFPHLAGGGLRLICFHDFSLPEMWAGRRSALPTFCRCLLSLAGGHSVFSFAAAASKIIFTQVSRPRAALMARS